MLHGCGVSIGCHFCTVCSNLVRSDIERPAGWQEDSEAGDTSSCAAIASEGNAAIILLRDPLADPEAEAGSFGGFGAEERLKESLRVLRLDPDSGIDDGNGNTAPLRNPINSFAH